MQPQAEGSSLALALAKSWVGLGISVCMNLAYFFIRRHLGNFIRFWPYKICIHPRAPGNYSPVNLLDKASVLLTKLIGQASSVLGSVCFESEIHLKDIARAH